MDCSKKYDWEHCDFLSTPISWNTLCDELGGGNAYLGLLILKTIKAHILHADKEHSWRAYDERHGFHVVRTEYSEAQEQYDKAKLHGMIDEDAAYYNEEKLAEDYKHLSYELGDTIAPIIRLLRMMYTRMELVQDVTD